MRRAPQSTASSGPPPRRFRFELAASAAAILAAGAIVGCGSGSGGGASSGQGGASSTNGGESTTSTAQAPHPKPVGEPPNKESLADAEKRIAAAAASGDCDKLNALNLVSLPNQDSAKRCQYLKKRLAGRKPTGSQSFGGLAAVIDYQTPRRHYTAVLLRDVDGLYHIAYFDPFHDSATVGTPFAPKFKDVAKSAFNALRTKNCDAYLKVAYARSGIASHGKKAVCPRVEKNAIDRALEKAPDAKPKLIGGNRFYAFYGLNTPRYFTMVLAREDPSQRPSGLKKGVLTVPKGAPEYAFVRAYRTNERKPPS